MKKKIKVLHIITRLDKGGAPKNTLITVSDADKNTFEVDLVSGISEDPELDVEKRTTGSGARLFIVPEIIRSIRPTTDFISIWKLYRLIRKEQYDIVHTHTSKPGVTGRIAAILAGVPVLIHTSHGHIYEGFFSSPVSWVLLQLDRFLSLFTHKIITLTERGMKEQIGMKIASPQKFAVVPSGIDVQRFATKKVDKKAKKTELGLSPDSTLIGHVARLVPLKGHSDLLKAVPKIIEIFPEAMILLAGDGPLREELEQEAKQLGISKHVFFAGHREDIEDIYSILDILVLPSELEGMGRVILEAMASSCPVAATNVMGIPELVVHGETGLLFPPRRPDKIAESICAILQNPEETKVRVQKAYAMLEGKYDHKSMVKKIEELYLSLVES